MAIIDEVDAYDGEISRAVPWCGCESNEKSPDGSWFG